MPHSFFLDSAKPDSQIGRFSFAGSDPFLVFKSKKDSVTLEWSGGKVEHISSDPFVVLQSLFKRYRVKNRDKDTPFRSGAVGYFSYDLKNFIEDLTDRSADDLDIPDCILGFYDKVNSCDNRDMSVRPAAPFKNPLPFFDIPRITSNFSKGAYIKAVNKAKDYIKRGDIYQVNLSQRFHTTLNMEPPELYSRLKVLSPAPFAAFLDFGEVKILSSSPERFLLKRGRYIETRPIKGTRPRSNDKELDLELSRELAESAKDRAEHIMIVDLERNDLGRVCEYGSVKPLEMFRLEKYANVFHLVSTVAGRLKKDIDAIDCLRATFPGGSITGAPKIRSMEIIEELEPVKRSVYTGAIGYISFAGDIDLSIVIRTFVIKGKDVYFQVGGGIVADSDPEKEYEETLHKARGLLSALGVGEYSPKANELVTV